MACSDEVSAWQVLVSHLPHQPVPQQQKLLCKLLCTSNEAHKFILKQCTGKLALRFSTYSTERLKAFVPWLSKHGALLASLSLEIHLCNNASCEAESAISSALQQAGQSAAPNSCFGSPGCWYAAPGLQLCSYCSHPAVAGGVLDRLDSYYLTHLELGRHAAYSSSFALEGLTRLARLTLYEDSADALLPSVSALTQLTSLALVDVSASSLKKLKFVPSQVMQMQLSLARLRKSEAPPPGLSLGHLTALTRLTNGEGSKPLIIQAGDTLPPALKVLRVRDCLDVSPLMALTGLQQLSMSASTTPAEPLQHLARSSSSSGGLQAISLCYGDMVAAAAASAGWPELPLVSLELRAVEGTLPAETLDRLGRLRRLRRLEVYGGQGGFAEAAVFEATQRQLANVLRQMKCLEVLGLRGFGLLPEPEPQAGHATVNPDPLGAHKPMANGIQPAAHSAAADDADDDTTATIAMNGTAGALCTNSTNSSSSDSSSSDSSSSSTVHLSLSGSGGSSTASVCSRSSSSICGGSLQPLMEAITSLPQLLCLTISSVSCQGELLGVDVAAAQALGAATQLTSLQLTDTCLTDESVNTFVCAGLTQMRRLVLDNNSKLTAAVLPDCLASQLTGLQELCVLRTGIRVSAESFKCRMMGLHPNLHLKSSAR